VPCSTQFPLSTVYRLQQLVQYITAQYTSLQCNVPYPLLYNMHRTLPRVQYCIPICCVSVSMQIRDGIPVIGLK